MQSRTKGCVQLTETFAITRKTKANVPFSCDKFSAEGSEYPKTVLKLSFGTIKMVAYVNNIYLCLSVTKKYGNVYRVDIIYLITVYIKLI